MNFRICKTGKCFLPAASLALLFFLFLVISQTAGLSIVSSGCLQCHEEDFDLDLEQALVIHEPCREKRCLVCHCPEAENTNREDDKPDAAATLPAPQRNTSVPENEIEIIDLHLHQDRFHSFRFPELGQSEPLLVEIWCGKSRLGLEKIPLPALVGLPVLDNRQRPPALKNIQVVAIESGIVASAVIVWETDTPASSQIEYGVDDFKTLSFPQHEYLFHHRVVLNDLKPRRLYSFKVSSTDLFGNQATSNAFFFSTAETLSEKNDNAVDADCGLVQRRFFRYNDQYLAIFQISSPGSLSIGRQAASQADTNEASSVTADNKGAERDTAVDLHQFLLDEKDTTINNCFSCHKGIRREMSHPIDVRPRAGMKVPKEYPLLADGRLSCMTCHVRHAGRYSFRLIRAQGRDFCHGCHSTY